MKIGKTERNDERNRGCNSVYLITPLCYEVDEGDSLCINVYCKCFIQLPDI